nr:hypothetical protein [Tanacetum cinerariifolium]
MFKDERLRVIQEFLQRVKLLEYGLSRTQEVLLKTNQWLFDTTTAKVKVIYRERVDSGLDVQALTTTFQIDDLDAFDSNCDEAPTASAVFMENLSTYDLDVLSEVQNYDTYQDNNVIDQSV